jgi:hypothetical protein
MTMAPAALARAPLPSLGMVLAGCPDCRAVLGIDGAPGLAAALAAHRRTCSAAIDICGGCGCEAELYPRGDDWRCADCLGQRLFDDLPGSASQPTHDPQRAGDQEPQAHQKTPRPEATRLDQTPGRLAALVEHQQHEPQQPKRGLGCTQPDLKPSHPAKPARSESAEQVGRDAA